MHLTYNVFCIGIFGLSVTALGNSFVSHSQYYYAMLHIARSPSNMALLYAMCVIFAFWIAKLFKYVFFGTLLRNEAEGLMDHLWSAITETFLAFAFFRDTISTQFLFLFSILLFFKSFHWIMHDRVNSMERIPFIGWKFNLRIVCLILIFLIVDALFILYAYQTIMQVGFSVQVIFGFEYTLLLVSLTSMTLKFIFHTIDLSSPQAWDGKTSCLMYTELCTSFIRLVLYLIMLAIMTQYIVIPLFAMWPTYIAFRTFRYNLAVIILAHKAVANLKHYQEPSQEELERYDDVCIVCREELIIRPCKKLPCGHIYHTSCLKSWFQRKQSCPLCRYDVLQAPNQAPQVGLTPQQVPNRDVIQPVQQPDTETAPSQANKPDSNVTSEINSLQSNEKRKTIDEEPKSKPNSFIQFPIDGAIAKDKIIENNLAKFPYNFPFAIPQPPFGPPPIPFPNKELTLEELKQLELEGKAGIEARLLLLHNVRQLLDCATIQLSSYLDSINSKENPIDGKYDNI